MKGEKVVFVCRECGYTNPKWLGRCPDCQSWNSFDEETVIEKSQKQGINRGRNDAIINKAEKLVLLNNNVFFSIDFFFFFQMNG